MVPGQCEEDIVERGTAQRDVIDADTGFPRTRTTSTNCWAPPLEDPVSRRVCSSTSTSSWPNTPLSRICAGSTAFLSLTTTSMRSPPTCALSSSAVPFAMILPVSTTAIVSGKLVGLLQVLRGEQQSGALAHQFSNHVPHAQAAARIQPGGRLSEHAKGWEGNPPHVHDN